MLKLGTRYGRISGSQPLPRGGESWKWAPWWPSLRSHLLHKHRLRLWHRWTHVWFSQAFQKTALTDVILSKYCWVCRKCQALSPSPRADPGSQKLGWLCRQIRLSELSAHHRLSVMLRYLYFGYCCRGKADVTATLWNISAGFIDCCWLWPACRGTLWFCPSPPSSLHFCRGPSQASSRLKLL